MKDKTEWKPKLDFTSESGVITAAEILEGEGYDIRNVFCEKDLFSQPIILLNGTKKQANKAFKFAINQNWPVKHLSKVWWHRNGKLTDVHWRLNFTA